MGSILRIFTVILVLNTIPLSPARVLAGSVPDASAPALDCDGTEAAYRSQGIPCHCVNGRIYCDQTGRSSGKKHNTDQDIRMMMVGTLFETLLTSIFADNKAGEKEAQAAKQKAAELARQQAALTRAQQAAAQAAFEKMMQFYKQLDDYQSAGFKTLSDSHPGFKTLDGEAEDLAAGARQPFDTASPSDQPMPGAAGNATPFFGDTMPIEDLRFLVNPDNDPNLVDLREAGTFIVQNLKNKGRTPVEAGKPAPAGEGARPETGPPACEDLTRKLNGYVHQRQQFQKTVFMAQEQVDTWKTANRNALLNAAKDGMETLSGHLLDKFVKRSLAADRLQRIYEKNAGRMAREGLDTAAIEARIKSLKRLSARGQLADIAGNMNEWQGFIKDGLSSLVKQLTDSNKEIEAMLDDPKLQKYFEADTPELETLLDISKIAAANKVFGKWVTRKLPLIAGVELAINQSYNALDFYLSYKSLAEANNINGRVLEAARSLQHNIDDTYLALRSCPR